MPAVIFAFSIVILLISVIIHEVMHGLAARYFGDHTAEYAGRLTLNPLPHIDPIGSILMPVLALLPTILYGAPVGPFLAWAKPVPVNPLHFNNIRLGEFVVAIAGIVANLVLASLAAILFHITGSLYFPLWANILSFVVAINVSLAVFNLLPIPPLDGSKVLGALLPPHLEYQYRQLDRYGFLILLVLLFSPLNNVLFGVISFFVGLIRSLLGV